MSLFSNNSVITFATFAAGFAFNKLYEGSKVQAKVNQAIHFASENKKTIAKVAVAAGVMVSAATALYSYGDFALENCTTSRDWLFRNVTHCEPTHLGAVVNAIKNNSTVIGIATGVVATGVAIYHTTIRLVRRII